MRARLRLRQIELSAALDDVETMLDVNAQCLLEGQRTGFAIDQRQQVDAEGGLHRGALVQFAQNRFGFGVLGHLQNDTHPLSVGFIAQVRQPFEMSIARQLGNAFDEAGLVDHVRKFGDDDSALAALHLFDVRLRLHCDSSAPRAVGGFDSLVALLFDDESARGEVGTFDEFHQLLNVDVVELFPTFEHVDTGIDNLTEIVRRNGSCHADSDTRRTVDQ